MSLEVRKYSSYPEGISTNRSQQDPIPVLSNYWFWFMVKETKSLRRDNLWNNFKETIVGYRSYIHQEGGHVTHDP